MNINSVTSSLVSWGTPVRTCQRLVTSTTLPSLYSVSPFVASARAHSIIILAERQKAHVEVYGFIHCACLVRLGNTNSETEWSPALVTTTQSISITKDSEGLGPKKLQHHRSSRSSQGHPVVVGTFRSYLLEDKSRNWKRTGSFIPKHTCSISQ